MTKNKPLNVWEKQIPSWLSDYRPRLLICLLCFLLPAGNLLYGQGGLAYLPGGGASQAPPDTVSKIAAIPAGAFGRTASLSSVNPADSIGGELRKPSQRLTLFGYYRLFLYGRNMTQPYPNLAPFERVYGVGDGYREPMLSLNVLARPNGRSSFGTELFVFTPYTGEGYEENVFSVNLGINFYGNFRTEAGNFGIRAGGIHWYNLSPFTVGVYQVLDRFSIFDRTPWEGVTHTDKYESYYQTGTPNPGDLRWNYQAFQGIILNGGQLPGDLAFDLFWGKTQPNGGLPGAEDDPLNTIFNLGTHGNVPTYQGFAGRARVLPSYLSGGKLQKNFRNGQYLAYNTIVSNQSLDSLSDDRRLFQVHSLSGNFNIGKVNVSGELGAGSFESPTYDQKWGEALMLRVQTPEELTFLPIDVQVYQIGKNFFNPNGEIVTNSNPDIQQELDFDLPAGAVSTGGLLTQVNQLAHNRRGININTGFDLGPLKMKAGWGLAAEIDPLSAQVSFIHRVNGLALSRIYNPFPANATNATSFGPFQRKFSFFRGASEQVQTTDLDPATAEAVTRKYYHAVDLQAKYSASLLGKPIYLFYLGSFASASSKAEAFPTLNDDSYLFVQYHELDLYYEILPNFILTGYLGLENARGGRFTEWGPETQAPLDQIGTGIGLGFDWTVAENAGIYFRHRWMDFEDRNFSLDQYEGREVTIELKVFF